MLPLLADQHARALRRLPREVADYYAGGAGDETTTAAAEPAWRAVRLRPRVLRDVGRVHTSCELLGTRLATPVVVGPAALHGLAHPDAERDSAAGAAAAGALTVLSTRPSLPLEQVGADPCWLQVYVLRDRGLTAICSPGRSHTARGPWC